VIGDCVKGLSPVGCARRGLEARKEEVADGKVGADAIGQKVVDFGSELPSAVVYDVVGHDIFPLGREYAIILAV
jgi:hypothetical protein